MQKKPNGTVVAHRVGSFHAVGSGSNTGLGIHTKYKWKNRQTIHTEYRNNTGIDYKHLLQMMIPAYNKKGCAAFHSRRESITGESPTSFPEENTTMPYSGFGYKPRVISTILAGRPQFIYKHHIAAWMSEPG
ncbi:hypothetical protein TNCV_3229761 [Trichonephila clavipes]|nr:hypothetical protein TNCV_3229761 [Trichonephila clavipes]